MKRTATTLLLLFVIVVGFAKSPKYVFYFIGDGMGPSHILGTELFMGEMSGVIGRPHKLNLSGLPYSAFVTTFSASNGVTDSCHRRKDLQRRYWLCSRRQQSLQRSTRGTTGGLCSRSINNSVHKPRNTGSLLCASEQPQQL